MSASAHTPAVDVYLSKENGELVLRQGINPLRNCNADKRILIIGGSVTGMTVCRASRKHLCSSLISLQQSAWAFLDAGYSVTIVSDRWASLDNRITSQIAGALYVDTLIVSWPS